MAIIACSVISLFTIYVVRHRPKKPELATATEIAAPQTKAADVATQPIAGISREKEELQQSQAYLLNNDSGNEIVVGFGPQNI